MPVYEYRRPDGSTFEVIQSFSDDALTHDPQTGEPVTRVLHAPAIHVKGGALREKQKRFLEREAARGSNEHDERFHFDRRERKKAEERYTAERDKRFKDATERAKVERKPPPKPLP
jgi:putative FmdB family regulatory protein